MENQLPVVQKCKICKVEQSISNFHFRKDTNTYRKDCKVCWAIKGKNYSSINKLKIAEYQKQFAQENKEHLKNYRSEYYITNKQKLNDRSKEDYYRNKDKYNKISKQWYEDNKVLKTTPLTAEQKEHKFKLNVIKKRLRQRTLSAIKNKGWKKSSKLYQYIGCTPEYLLSHIESQFLDGMSWQNRGEWHIDHIMPLASADSIQDLYLLCNYRNLRPLWGSDNWSKHDAITIEGLKIFEELKTLGEEL